MARLALLYTRLRPASAWDIRFRVASVGVFSLAALSCPPWALFPIGLGLAVLFRWARIGLRETARLVGSLAAFFVFFWGIGVLLTPTWESAGFLALQSVRLLFLFLVSHFLMVTATPLKVTAAIQWFLGFLGKRRAWWGASMAGWALASVPQILDHASGLSDAATLRGLTMRRPLVWAKLMTLGLLVRVVEQAATLTDALEARSFGNAWPHHGLRARPLDYVITGLWMAWCFSWMMGK